MSEGGHGWFGQAEDGSNGLDEKGNETIRFGEVDMRKLDGMRVVSVVMICILLGSCGKNPSNELATIAEEFISKLLTIPNEAFRQFADPEEALADEEQYQKDLTAAIRAFCGDVASEKLLDSSPFVDLVTMHLVAAGEGEPAWTVERVELEELEDTRYHYKAVITVSDQENPLEVIGSIQFDDGHQIDFVNIRFPK